MSSKVQAFNYTADDLTLLDYPFSTITHVDEVMAIVGHLQPQFVFRSRDGFIFCSYKRVTSETFPVVPKQKLNEKEYRDYLYRRELRGIAFDEKTGQIISRCLHKFFNVGERPDSSIHVVQKLIEHSVERLEPIYIMEKLDGSMVAPLITPDRKIRLRTKMGFNNDTSNACEREIYGTNDVASWPTADEILERYEGSDNEHERVLYFCAKWISKGYTPMFEFYNNDTRVVIQYDKSFFTLIALRETVNGKYVGYADMSNHAAEVSIPVVPATVIKPDHSSTAKEILEMVKKLDGKEGCVMRFYDGQMFKLKSEWYSDLHRLKQHIVYNAVNEGNVWALVFDDRVDDAVPLLANEEQIAVKTFNDDLWKAVGETAVRALAFCDKHPNAGQREFADAVKNETKNSLWAKVLYLVRRADRSEAEDQIVTVLRPLLFKDLNAARELIQAPELMFFKNYLKTVRQINEDDL